MHIAANKDGISDLEKLAAIKFAGFAKDEWWMEAFADAIELVYTSTADRDRSLRNSIMDVTSKHAKALYREDYGARFRQVVRDTPPGSDLAAELAEHVVSKNEPAANSPRAKSFICSCGFKVAETQLTPNLKRRR